jgi:hypothetical protein
MKILDNDFIKDIEVFKSTLKVKTQIECLEKFLHFCQEYLKNKDGFDSALYNDHRYTAFIIKENDKLHAILFTQEFSDHSTIKIVECGIISFTSELWFALRDAALKSSYKIVNKNGNVRIGYIITRTKSIQKRKWLSGLALEREIKRKESLRIQKSKKDIIRFPIIDGLTNKKKFITMKKK